MPTGFKYLTERKIPMTKKISEKKKKIQHFFNKFSQGPTVKSVYFRGVPLKNQSEKKNYFWILNMDPAINRPKVFAKVFF